MAINFTDFFTRAGRLLAYAAAINTARGTTFPGAVVNVYDELDGEPLALRRTIEGIEPSLRAVQTGCAGGLAAVRGSLSSLLIETILDDTPLVSRDETAALVELIRQMVAESETVDASAVAATATPAAHNHGDGVVVASIKRPDGLAQENSLDETIRGIITGANSISYRGAAAVADRMSHDWPGGSGASSQGTVISGAASLLGNGSFDSVTAVPNSPDDWIVAPGTIGTTIKTTEYEVQEIEISGTPTAGTYQIAWENQDGHAQTTEPLAYNANGLAVQAALRRLTGLERVTVETTGTDPDFTHTITFVGVAGNLNQITIVQNLTGETITPDTVSAGSANAFLGRAVELDSNGAELTALYRRVPDLQALTQYAVNLWAMVDVVPAAGVLEVALVDGIGGTVIDDEQGAANLFTFNAASLTTSFAARSGVFRTPRVLPPIVFLRVRISTAVSNTTSVFLDEVALAEMRELYSGGPYAAAFSGAVPLSPGDSSNPADEFEIEVSNGREGAFQEWFHRVFDMAAKGLLLPSNGGGSETIDDALIA